MARFILSLRCSDLADAAARYAVAYRRTGRLDLYVKAMYARLACDKLARSGR